MQGGAKQHWAHHHFVWVPGSFCVSTWLICLPAYVLLICDGPKYHSWHASFNVFLQGCMHDRRVSKGALSGCCRRNITGYQCTRLLPVLDFMSWIFFLSSFSWLCCRQTPLLPAMCEAHMVKWNCCLREHASACPDFIRGIKEWDEKNQNKMMIAGPWLLSFSFSFFPAPHTLTPSSVLSRVEHQMTEKTLLLGCNGL